MLNKLSLCGEDFYRSYVLGIRAGVGVQAVTGTAVHTSMRYDLGRKLESGQAADIKDVRECAAEALDATWLGEEPLLDADERSRGAKIVRAEAKDNAVMLATVGHYSMVPFIQPTGLEVKRRIELDGFPFDLEGTSDIEEEGKLALWDIKTSARKYAADAAFGAPQLDMYAFMRAAEGKTPLKTVGFQVLVKTKLPKHQVVVAPAPTNFPAIRLRIERATAVVQAGAFMPVDPSGPSGWKCSEAFCGHFNDCPFGRARRVQI